MKKLLVAAALVGLVAVIAGPATAGHWKGKAGGGSAVTGTIELVRLTSDGARLTGGTPAFGEQVTFHVETSRTTEPYVWLRCFQGGARVYSHTAGFFPSYRYSTVFTLGPTTLWTSGSADCEAQLLDRSHGNKFPGQVLARTTFHVDGA